jgi:hypothetical protein
MLMKKTKYCITLAPNLMDKQHFERFVVVHNRHVLFLDIRP